jgi:F-type H+-transporting ATPase subunit epsilon
VAKSFQVDVVSPEATIWSGRATIVVARTPEGELGVMADHEPLMGALATGPVEIEAESGERTIIGVHGGFIQVLNNQVTLITDRAQITKDVAEASAAARELAEVEAEEAEFEAEFDGNGDQPTVT